jgi:hypothetical protein
VPNAQGPGPHSSRLDTPESRRQALESLARFLKNSGARQYFPGAFDAADKWLKELQSGDPTPEQVQGFQSYMAMLKLANLQRGVVSEAANTAYSELVEMAKSTGAAAGGASDLGGPAESVAKTIIGGAIDYAAGKASDAAIDATGGTAAGAQGLIDSYNSQADDYLKSLLPSAQHGTTVGFTEPSKLAFAQWDVLKSQYDQVSVTIEKAEAFTPLTGDGSALDTALRTGLKVVSGPAGTTLDVAAIIGNSAEAKYHYEAAVQALQIAGGGAMDSLMGLGNALHL